MASRRERKKQDTRATILRVGRTLFAERGVDTTRVADITERVDLGKGAFYNYFDSKQALIAALIREGVEVLRKDYLAAGRAQLDLRQRIDAVVSAHIAFFEERPDYAKLFHQARGFIEIQPSESATLESAFAEYLEAIGSALVPEAQERQNGADEKVLDLAAAVAGAIAGYRSFRIASGQKPNAETLSGLLTSGLNALAAPTELGKSVVGTKAW